LPVHVGAELRIGSPIAGVFAGRRRGHAAVDQVYIDLVNGPLNHLPSSAFDAHVAWPQSAAAAHAPTRAVGTRPQPGTPWRTTPPSAPS
jgi:hypothetical protein